MSHTEILTLLDASEASGVDCAGVNGLVDEHIGHVAERIDELNALKGQLLCAAGAPPGMQSKTAALCRSFARR
ncbi:UNVERIFIED_ORG: hypothetical protein J2734_007432 [Burkholderia cepacia]|jgi:MerR, DNA binding|nr:hypothetical protein [Burkholderia cepacia]MDP9599847.1 hypothetical protein [Burkholderia cepacia]